MRPVKARGYCSKHYWRWYRTRKPDKFRGKYEGDYMPLRIEHSKTVGPYWVTYVSGRGDVFVHRIIMEYHLGRRLRRNEHVHHKDENGLNNALENLEITDANNHIKEHPPERHKQREQDPF
jgi:hypothetical protein